MFWAQVTKTSLQSLSSEVPSIVFQRSSSEERKLEGSFSLRNSINQIYKNLSEFQSIFENSFAGKNANFECFYKIMSETSLGSAQRPGAKCQTWTISGAGLTEP